MGGPSAALYLTGSMTVPDGFNGEIAVLPPAYRPTHYLYMMAFSTGWNSANALVNYAVLRIDPGGGMWVFAPPGFTIGSLGLAGLSFHLLS
jgi:hypothetical protein